MCTSWIAVEGATVAQLAPVLSRVSAWNATNLPGGWAVFSCRMQRDGLVAEPDLLAKLSRGGRLVAGDEEDHVMYSAAAEWRDGREVWAAIHASEESRDHLVTRGDLPEGWIAIRDEQLRKQEPGVDYVYEIPPEIAKLVVAYRVDDENDVYDYVEVAAAPRKPWWKLW